MNHDGNTKSLLEGAPQDNSNPAIDGTPAASKELIIEALKTVEDPELFLDIWFLGLIYGIEIEGGKVGIKLTFTSPMCPAGPMLIDQVKTKVGAVPGVTEVQVEVVFSPPWQPSEDVKALLGLT